MIALLTFVLTSATFKAGAHMPLSTVYSQCSGANISPELRWHGAPASTKSFALIVHDPDAPHPGGWYHWVAYNLPAETQMLSTGQKLEAWQLGRTSFNEIAYGGPCPPPGKPHHYVFTLYALDVARISGDHLSGPQLEEKIAGHVLAKTTLTGLYQTK